MSEENFEIYFDDLNDRAKQEFLKAQGLETPDDGNYDVMPIAVVPIQQQKKYAVNFDIGFYIEVMATSEDEAIEKAKDRLHDAKEGEAHNFEARVKE